MTVIGEGIVTHDQYTILKEMGGDVGLGYLFVPAVPAEDLGLMLQEDMSLAPSC
jgi:EAL domain-containing protein (putative c-di-GMP-specific phosphodiesterase class I)